MCQFRYCDLKTEHTRSFFLFHTRKLYLASPLQFFFVRSRFFSGLIFSFGFYTHSDPSPPIVFNLLLAALSGPGMLPPCYHVARHTTTHKPSMHVVDPSPNNPDLLTLAATPAINGPLHQPLTTHIHHRVTRNALTALLTPAAFVEHISRHLL
jgi:hypothetical protein